MILHLHPPPSVRRREKINAMVSKQFGGRVQNTYKKGAHVPPIQVPIFTHPPSSSARKKRSAPTDYTSSTAPSPISGHAATALNPSAATEAGAIMKSISTQKVRKDHFYEAVTGKFVLCPSGLGFDTYRLWETILLGSIPVVESNAGFDRTYSNLPVLVVRDYSELTPRLLDVAYPCFLNNAHRYDYRHLTESYWLDAIDRAIDTGSITHFNESHPYRNKYCDFLDFRHQ